MNAFSMLGDLDWWQKLLTIVDAIPKLIFLLYTCVASAVDAMQLLVRRLCGLDLYINNAGEVVRDQDPLTEFINGILGIGDTSGAMQALNTTFWSLTIFALILLSLTTIVAIIKSHYNEDVGKTSPAKILYGAFKSILTFFIVPAAVVIGLQLSSLLLRTLDDITAGTTDAATIDGIYGSNNRQRFAPYTSGYEGDTFSSYGGYDMFGIGQPATNSPISGQLFRAAAYNCNRFRTSGYTLDNINGDGPSMSMGGLFGQGPSYEAAADKMEYVAYQVDYAFINNLQLSSPYDYNTLKANANDTENGARIRHLEFAFDRSLDSFSKYDIAFVWVYYDLWNFNFIVGFAGAISAFGIMISIIIGLMMRLIKSAAMFLIYPPLLGLAPMDDFKAFKSWSNEFIKQILSAFGAIVGLNLLFLILPYVQQISFFDIGLLDAIVNCVFLITGLIMAKDFISMVAGFVGGGDVFSTGDGAKGQVAKTMGTGIKAAVGAGAMVTKAGLLPASVAFRGGKALAAKRRVKRLNEAKDAIDKYENRESAYTADPEVWKKDSDFVKEQMKAKGIKDIGKKFSTVRKNLKKIDPSLKGKDLEEAVAKTVADAELSGVTVDRNTYLAGTKAHMEKAVKKSRFGFAGKMHNKDQEKLGTEEGREELKESIDKRITKKAERNYINTDGTASGKGAGIFALNTLSQAFGPLKLFAKDISANLNVDKLAGQFKTLSLQARGKDAQGNDAFKSRSFNPNEKKEAREKFEKMATDQGYTKGTADFDNFVNKNLRRYYKEQSQELASAIQRGFQKALGGTVLSGANIPSGETKYAGEKLQQQQLKATTAQTDATKKQSDKIDELIKTMESFIKSAGGGGGTP